MNPGPYLFTCGLLISTIDTVYTLYCLVHPNSIEIHSGWSCSCFSTSSNPTLGQDQTHSLQHILLSPWPTASSPLMRWAVPILVCLVLHIWQPGALIQAVSPFGLSPLCVPQLCNWLCSTLSMLSWALPSVSSSAPITSLFGCAPWGWLR